MRIKSREKEPVDLTVRQGDNIEPLCKQGHLSKVTFAQKGSNVTWLTSEREKWKDQMTEKIK